VSLTIEDEVGAKGVEGTLTAKWKEPYTGITFDKIKLKGTKVAYEASKSVDALKIKCKGDPTDLNSTSGSADLKGAKYALTAGADKSKLTASVAALLFPGAVAGGEASYALSGGAVAYSCGASFTHSPVFGSLIYNSKKIFSLALLWTPLPKLSLAASVDSDKKAPTVGLKYGLAPSVTVGAKSTKDTLALLYVNKLGKDASLVVSAESKYADLANGAKPLFGATLTVG